ncbi:MAG: DEAD/DEAH box helicase family protein, partial [Lachnospiraceae bacterium]|nr:DEAD/DEAH box helicase family protein [Lachnospiraceae bacterium]
MDKNTCIELYAHNREAYDKLCILLRKHKKACIIHPTGTGKSFIAFKYIEDNPDKKVLWLSPSQHIFASQISNLIRSAGAQTTVKIRERIIFSTYTGISNGSVKRFRNIGVIILDEFHRCGARIWNESLKKVLKYRKRAVLIGLSATHIRYLDSQRDMAEEIFGGNVASYLTLSKAFDRGILR